MVVDGGILPPLCVQQMGGKIHLDAHQKFKVRTEKRKVRENNGIRHPSVFTCLLCTSLSLHAESRECITAQKVPLEHCMIAR